MGGRRDRGRRRQRRWRELGRGSRRARRVGCTGRCGFSASNVDDLESPLVADVRLTPEGETGNTAGCEGSRAWEPRGLHPIRSEDSPSTFAGGLHLTFGVAGVVRSRGGLRPENDGAEASVGAGPHAMDRRQEFGAVDVVVRIDEAETQPQRDPGHQVEH